MAKVLVALSLLLAAAVQSDRPTFHLLFIGNSLTSANDLPGMVEAVARASGFNRKDFRVHRVTRDGFSLRDHWELGEARRVIQRGGWTHVILQQGPSSLPESQVELIDSSRRFAEAARAIGARTVLYGVWPPRQRLAALDAVTHGYRRAAEATSGLFVPAGEGWRAAWTADPALALYGTDAFHPAPEGTYLAALMIFEAVTGQTPARRLVGGARLTGAQLDTVRAAAREALRRPAAPVRQIAVTIDDLPTVSVLGEDLVRAQQTTDALLEAIRRADVPAIGFVNERKLQTDGTVDPRRVALLERWIAAGLDLGNHTFSHPDLHRVDPSAFEADIAAGDAVTRRLMTGAGRQLRYFRHPFLHTGRSREVRDRIEAFLRKRGYTVAPVTIDNYDYVFAAAYDRATGAGDAALARKVRDEYLRYLEAVVEYYERQSAAILGREIAQTLLLHANALNGATFDELVSRLRRRGYEFVTLEAALRDPAYGSRDEYFGGAGMTWLHRWALTKGLKGIFAGEPEVPAWVNDAADSRR